MKHLNGVTALVPKVNGKVRLCLDPARSHKILQANLKINEDKCLFRCTSITFFGKVIMQYSVSPDPRNVQAQTAMPLPKCKKELQTFLGILNYLSALSPMTAKVYNPQKKLTSVKTEWSWNNM